MFRYLIARDSDWAYFANDPLGRIDLANCYVDIDGNLRADIGGIKAGCEILLAYGPEFWSIYHSLANMDDINLSYTAAAMEAIFMEFPERLNIIFIDY